MITIYSFHAVNPGCALCTTPGATSLEEQLTPGTGGWRQSVLVEKTKIPRRSKRATYSVVVRTEQLNHLAVGQD